ncbi:hypothetical protein GCM10010123_43530 [Pilimelia anulata]|uniref:Uncharacterized protein n=1 Tax=Pilimelia anulata TaxID=53371 RepID=A0A8J3BEX7_9ACTN|nr:polysaccharide biosynthesis C-terminal domain-containing protein [Pilimelia anulata]GGK08950.1 hypothetical protein GCM10010123_43530 [Pilimelia anulata]
MATLTRPPGAGPGLGGAARHSVANLAGVGLTALAAFGLNVVVTRVWSPAAAGLFFVVTSLFLLLLAVVGLGSGTGVVYFVSRYVALHRPERVRPVLAVGLGPVLGLGAVCCAAGWVLAPRLVGLLPGLPAGVAAGDVVLAVRVLLPFLPLAAAADFALAACRGLGAMRPLLLVERLGRSALQVAAVLLVAAGGWAATAALPLAWVAPYLPAAAAALLWLRALVARLGRATAGGGGDWRAEWRPFWAYTGPRALATVLQVALQRIDIVLLGALRGLGDAAVYTAATRFLVLGQLAGQALSTSVQHRLAAHLARGERAAAGELYRVATGWLVLLAWPVYLGCAWLAGPMLRLFGPGYGDGRAVTVLLALAMLVATGCGMVDAVLMMAGRTSWTLYNALAAGAVNVSGNLLWIPPYGLLGAAVAWVLAILINNLVPLVQLRAALGLHPFGRETLAAAGLALACFGVPPLLATLAGAGGPAGVAAALAAGAALYGAGVWRLRRVLRLDALRALRRGGRQSDTGQSVESPAADR